MGAISQSSFLLSPHSRYSSRQRDLPSNRSQSTLSVTLPTCFLSTKPITFPTSHAEQKQRSWTTLAGLDSESIADLAMEGMSMSQKLSLGYAVLVGIGGAMGYLKGESKISLIAGGLSALVLYYVYTLLPSNPVLASSIGFALSASLLGVMGARFKKSGKIFPAGIISFVALVMSGGYLHGILHSLD